MTRCAKLVLAGATVLTFAVAISSASASKLSLNGKQIRAAWSALRFSNFSTNFTCRVTLEGSFSSATFRKIEGALIGFISSAAKSCFGLSGILRESLPWPMFYFAFNGTLPRITEVGFDLEKVAFLTFFNSRSCLWRTEVNQPLFLWFQLTGTQVREASLEGAIPLFRELDILNECAATVTVEGREFEAELLGTTSFISIHLI